MGKIFKNTFRFTGGEIVNEFLMSTGYFAGAHIESCPIYKKLMKTKPRFLIKYNFESSSAISDAGEL